MGGASNLIGTCITGQRTGRTWTVTEQLKFEPGRSAGVFSICYKIIDAEGNEAFLKASDVTLALAKSDPLLALIEITTAHQFERTILEHCRGNRLDKVVTALDSGTLEVIDNGTRDMVFFIVFELAKGDLRKFVSVKEGNDLVWILSAMHSFATAVSQIHSVGIFHNDLKPANVLVFENDEKVADFGRATSPLHPVPHDPNLCAGDRRFAPPEQLYFSDNGAAEMDRFLKARAGDLNNLGSVIHFLITKRMLTPDVINRLTIAHKPNRSAGGWCDSYDSVLPFWRQSYDAAITEFFDDLPETWITRYKFALEEIKLIILHLCEPDFRLRGDLVASEVNPAKYSIEKIISRLDNLRSRVLVISRAK